MIVALFNRSVCCSLINRLITKFSDSLRTKNMLQFASISIVSVCLQVLVTSVRGQSPASFGSCPDHPVVKDFDLEEFQGGWYEIERSFYIFELLGYCPKFNFTLGADGNLQVEFSMKNRFTGNTNVFNGMAFVRYDNPAIWDYRVTTNFPRYISRMMPGSGKYYVLDTDYTNYAILWSCSNLGLIHSDLVWVLGREQQIRPEQRTLLYSKLRELKIDEDRLVLSKCPA